MVNISRSADELAHIATTQMSEASRTTSSPLLNASPLSATSPRQNLASRVMMANQADHIASSSPGEHAATATPIPISSYNQKPEDTPLGKSNPAIDNFVSAQARMTVLAKAPARAPPNLTVQIPRTPASSSGNNSARHMSSAVSIQSLPERRALQNKAQVSSRPKLTPSRFAGRGTEFRGFAGGATHTNSRTWVKDQLEKKETWHQVEKALKKMEFIPRSTFVPKTFGEWLGHEAAVISATAKRTRRLKALKEQRKSLPPPQIKSKFEEKEFTDGLSAVLAIPTVWSKWYRPTEFHPEAPWPSTEEMKEEGNERLTSHYGRFPALVRQPANQTVAWKQRKLVAPYPLDAVWRLTDVFECAREATARQKGWEQRIQEELAAARADNDSIKKVLLEVMTVSLDEGFASEEAEGLAVAAAKWYPEKTAMHKVEEHEKKASEAERIGMEKFLCDSLIDGLNLMEE